MASSTAKEQKTYNRRDFQMITHSSTSRPVQCLCMAERTGCPVFTDLWSYVLARSAMRYTIIDLQTIHRSRVPFNRHEAHSKADSFARAFLFGRRDQLSHLGELIKASIWPLSNVQPGILAESP